MTTATDLTGVDAVIAEARRDFECRNDEDLAGALAVLCAEAREEIARLRLILADIPEVVMRRMSGAPSNAKALEF